MSQPKRTNCKLCKNPLQDSKKFASHNLNYHLCSNCNHINGEFEESEVFSRQVYISDDYGYTYNSHEKSQYDSRCSKIYTPKVDFLLEALSKVNVNKNEINMLDIGAGSGYFVNAARLQNIATEGIEISEKQVNFGNLMIGSNALKSIPIDELNHYIENTTCNIISAIGVLEHLIDFHPTLNAIKKNKNINYFFFSVPTFSYSCVLEAASPDVFNRQLGGAHTHLFTLESIRYMMQQYGFTESARWQFGTDAMDFLRIVSIHLSSENKDLQEIFFQKFIKSIDDIQLVIDKSDFCSEVHMLLKINHD